MNCSYLQLFQVFVPKMFLHCRGSNDLPTENTRSVTSVRNIVLALTVLSQAGVVGEPSTTVGTAERFNLSVLLPKVVPHTLRTEKLLTAQVALVPTLLVALHVLGQADFLNEGQVTSLVAALVLPLPNVGFQMTRQTPDMKSAEETLHLGTLVAA